MVKATAIKACAVDTFDVARSLRMNCSRACNVSTYPVRCSPPPFPSASSLVRPTMRPGICLKYFVRAANNPRDGPP